MIVENQYVIKIKNFIKANKAIILTSFLVLSLISNIVFYYKYNSIKNYPQKAVQEDTKRLIKKVGELVVLPENEQPTIATVSDPEQLKGQPFFDKAKKGDKVLIFAAAGKIILYDPINNKIVNIASVNLGGQEREIIDTPIP